MRLASFLLLIPMLAGCEQPSSPPDSTRGTVSVSERMGSTPDPGFRRADRPRSLDFPADHGAHPEYATEWWYFTGNLWGSDAARFGYQFTLFRVGLAPGTPAEDSPWRSHQLYMGHLAVTDIDAQQHHSSERFSRAAAGLAGADTSPLRVWLGSWALVAEDKTGLFPLRLRAEADDIAIDFTLQPGNKERVLQGEQGWSRKGAAQGNASYYYSYTRLPTQGRIRIGTQWHEVEGSSWFDREWSSSALAEDQAGWDWFALQLEDGRDLMFYRMRDRQGHAQIFSQGVLVEADGQITRLDLNNTRVQPSGFWTTPDGVRYPVRWQVSIPAKEIELTVEAAVSDQEMNHSVRYWEGAVDVRGSQSGLGYLELSGYSSR